MRPEDKKINDLPDIAISADHRPERRRGNASGPKPAMKKKTSERGRGFPWLLLVLVITLAGGGGWQLFLLQETLSETRQELALARDQLSSVTGEVTATGKNLDQSGSAIRTELKGIDSEIRKLWDVSNKRNRHWIVINKDNIVKVMRASDNNTAAVEKIQEQLQGLDQQIKAVSSEQVAAKSEASTSIEVLQEQLTELRGLLSQQQEAQSELLEKMDSQQNVVESVDAFRQQVNRKLQQLETTVREFTQPPQQGLGLQ